MDITLEKFGSHDFADYFRLVSNPEVMAMITERAIPADEARRDYDKMLAENALHPDLGHFRVLDAQDGRFIGLGKLAVETAEANQAELGYILAPEYWGKGIASRIATLLVARAERQPALRSLFAIIDPANIPSRKILTNNGFVSKEFKDFDGLPGEVLERHW
ncbi:GNAT family N-acetyltransferase [Brucella pseudintermedia]|uniref:GNAT family N-acetyltransferase n=1 Tax=Brucella pseudintermedia TaxID=370111 RepID=UPI00124E375B|nr:GNAT family N-acetyltransferase [Brucella pseudintermedia]KAB2680888.1 GNAT family N-acetyltransferase [Brucella pseudintermedia]